MREALAALRAAVPGMTGLVIHNEPVVPILLEVLTAGEIRIPDDLSVISVCPDDVAERAATRLTSVAIPVEQIGTQAVQLVMAQLDRIPVAPTTLLPPRVVDRGSTARRA